MYCASLRLLLVSMLCLGWALAAGAAPFAYISDPQTATVTVIDTSTNTVVTTIPVGGYPVGVAVHPNGTRVYVANANSNAISVIDTSANAVITTVSAGQGPSGVAVHPAGTRVYVTNQSSSNVSDIDTSTKSVIATVAVGFAPTGVAVHPDGSRVYVADQSNVVSVINSTVMIWGSQIDYAGTISRCLANNNEDMVGLGAVGQLIMNEHQQPLQQRAPLLPTGVPNGVDEAFRAIGYGRQTRQVQPRRGHEDQAPVCPHGFGPPHAIRVEAQLPRAVLIKRFRRPAVHVPTNDLGRSPVHPVRPQHHRPSGQRLVLNAHHHPHRAQTGDADRQGQAPLGVLAYAHGTIRLRRDQWHPLLHREVGARQLQRPAMGIAHLNAGGCQQAVLVEQAAPVRVAPGQDADHVLR